MRELSIPTKKTNPIHNDVLKNTIFLLLDQSSGEANIMGPFTPVTSPTFGISLLVVKVTTSSMTNSHTVASGVYKAWERIHRCMVDRSLKLYLELSQKNKHHLHKFFYFSHQTKHLAIENITNTRLD